MRDLLSSFVNPISPAIHHQLTPCTRRDFLPAVDLPQLDLPARYEAEEQYDGGVFTRERAMRLYPAAKFFVEPLDDVCGAQRLPLRFREAEEGEQFL